MGSFPELFSFLIKKPCFLYRKCYIQNAKSKLQKVKVTVYGDLLTFCSRFGSAISGFYIFFSFTAMKKNLLLYGSIGLLGICLSSIAFANSSLYSLKAANPANNNQLSAQNWDRLVSEVEKIQTSPASNKTQRDALLNEVQQLKLQVSNASSGSGIPAGAIMAFDLSTCPA